MVGHNLTVQTQNELPATGRGRVRAVITFLWPKLLCSVNLKNVNKVHSGKVQQGVTGGYL